MSFDATVSGMRICPRCQGTMTVNGRECKVCKGSGVLTQDGKRVSYEDGLKYYDWWQEQVRYKTRFRR